MHRFRLLTHEVTLDAPAELADRLPWENAGSAIPVLCRTSYALRPRNGSVSVLEDDAELAVEASMDDALRTLDSRLRLRVFDLAARSGWLPLQAGLLVAGERAWLLVGADADDRARLIEQSGQPGTAGFTLIRSGEAVGYGGAPEPRAVSGIVLLDDEAVTGALLAARVETGVRRPSADVAEIATVLRRAHDVLVAGPDGWSAVLARLHG